jgi:hypothetical protein
MTGLRTFVRVWQKKLRAFGAQEVEKQVLGTMMLATSRANAVPRHQRHPRGGQRPPPKTAEGGRWWEARVGQIHFLQPGKMVEKV